MKLIFGFTLLALLLPFVVITILAEMTIAKFLLLTAGIILSLGGYYAFTSEWLSRWSNISNIIAISVFVIALILISFFLILFKRRKAIKSLDWDESMDIKRLTVSLKRYLAGLGWKMTQSRATMPFRIERADTKLMAMLYTSDMPNFYDTDKICSFILSDTRQQRMGQKHTFAVIAMFDLNTSKIAELSANRIEFVFYRDLGNFLHRLESVQH